MEGDRKDVVALFIALCALILSIAALLVARRSSEREKNLMLIQRRSDMIGSVRETRRALEVHSMMLQGMVSMTKDAVQNTRLERLFEDAQSSDKRLADLRMRLESTMIPPQPTPAIYRDLEDLTADVATARREVEHHAEETGDLRAHLDVIAAKPDDSRAK